MLIGLTGYAGSGKDTAAAHLRETHGFARIAFADKVKELVYAQNPRLVHPLGVRLRVIIDGVGWDTAKRQHPAIRELLQEAGQAHREVFGEDFWVLRALSRYTGRPAVISDVRYPNEAARVRYLGGVIVRVERPGVGPVNDHESERELAAEHYALNVDGRQADFYQYLDAVVASLKNGDITR